MEIEVNLRRYRWTPLYYEASKKNPVLGRWREVSMGRI